ncbi:MAG: peptidylprolyl isomerase [Alistipes sp.]|nr:peptidylprolyl isomerase [Alistipes sp.]
MKQTLFSLFLAALLLSACDAPKSPVQVIMTTSMGEIHLELSDATPQHRDNFVKLVKEGYFDGLLFHRVIENFMIQGGDPDSRHAEAGAFLGEGGPGYTIPAEFRYPELFHRRGALAAAREGDMVNPEKASAGSQFYIVWGKVFTDEQLDQMQQRIENRVVFTPEIREVYKTEGGTPHLDGAYTVFGHVTQGLEVVDAIQKVTTDENNRPTEDVRILSAKIKE